MMIYILWCSVYLSVCNEKWSLPTSELSAGGAKWAARFALPAVGRLWPSDDDDDDGDDDDDDDDEDDDDEVEGDSAEWGNENANQSFVE